MGVGGLRVLRLEDIAFLSLASCLPPTITHAGWFYDSWVVLLEHSSAVDFHGWVLPMESFLLRYFLNPSVFLL